MQTFLIVSPSPSFIEKEIEKKKQSLDIALWNYHDIIPLPSLGIESIRNLHRLLAQKPYGGGNRLVVIQDMQKATLEAQNALLKLLEEPPEKTTIILTSPQKESLLETIVSRALLITDSNADKEVPDDGAKIQTLIIDLLGSSAGKRLQIAQTNANTREETLNILHSLTQTLVEHLHRQTIPSLSPKQTGEMLKKIEAARSYIERNINYKATLDILFLGFPKCGWSGAILT